MNEPQIVSKRDYLLEALKNRAYIDAQWVISCISIVKEDPSKVQEWYPYKLEKTNNSYSFRRQEDDERILIEGFQEPFFKYTDPIELKAGDLPGINKDMTTTVGNLLQNCIIVIEPFKGKVEYINQRFDAGTVESIIKERVNIDNSPDDLTKPLLEQKINFDEYDRFCDGCVHLMNFNNVCVPANTYASLIPPPGIEEKRQELLEKYKDKLDDPVTHVMIEQELIKFDKEQLANDRSSGFLISGKDFNVVRKKVHIGYGTPAGFDKTKKPVTIKKPIAQGLDFYNLPAYNNDARHGSFSRGAETQLGGVSVKELLRASVNLAITEDDCGATIGQAWLLDKSNIKKLYGFTLITEEGQVKLTKENQSKYLDKTYQVRFPSYCKTKGTGFCSTCCGPHLSLHKTGLSSSVAETGNTLLYIFMKAMHGKAEVTERLNLRELIS